MELPQVAAKPVPSLRTAKIQRMLVNRALDLLLILLILLILFPIIYLVLNSFKTNSEITSSASFLPQSWRFDNYREMWESVGFGKYFANSLIICGATTVIVTLLASLTGYALARFRFPGSGAFGLAILGTQLIPGIMFLIPLYMTFIWIKNTFGLSLVGANRGAIVLYVGFFLPMSLWIMRGFFAAIPTDLEEQAMVDGATRFTAFWRIVLPLAAPGIVATAIYVFLAAWDELLFAWVLDVKTIPVGIRLYMGQYQNRYELMSAAAVVITLPVALLFFLVQRRMIQGLTAGAVK